MKKGCLVKNEMNNMYSCCPWIAPNYTTIIIAPTEIANHSKLYQLDRLIATLANKE